MKIFKLLFFIITLASCTENKAPKVPKATTVIKEFTKIVKDDYELYKPKGEIKAVLILFGGYPEVAEDVMREFKILDVSKENDVAILISNFNRKLWLLEDEKLNLATRLQEVIEANELPTNNVYIGGYSSGGLVASQLSNYIVGMKQFYIDPKGIFIVDSPVDLADLYTISKKNIERNFSEPSVEESNWILHTFGTAFGNPADSITQYEKHAVYTLRTHNIENLRKLKNTKIRLYTEPDSTWWKENKMAEYIETNSYHIKCLAEDLKIQGFTKVEYIPTKDKGYRANGDRHPHSWSIIDKEELVKWMLGD